MPHFEEHPGVDRIDQIAARDNLVRVGVDGQSLRRVIGQGVVLSRSRCLDWATNYQAISKFNQQFADRVSQTMVYVDAIASSRPRAGSGNLDRTDKWNFCLTSA